MDRFSILGILVGFAAIILGQFLEGGSLMSLFNLPAFIIVIGGTLGAVLLETPIKTFKYAIKISKKAFISSKVDPAKTIEHIMHWSRISRKDGFLGLEKQLQTQEFSPFSQTALQLLIDGKESEYIEEVMNNKLHAKQDRELSAIKVFESMGGYSPTIGIIGAVIGLIQVLGNLSNPENLGPGIAIAFVATIYGVGFANLVFIPIAKRLKSILVSELIHDQMVLDGILLIRTGENPHLIERKLQAFNEAA